jgi:hypothetical protein
MTETAALSNQGASPTNEYFHPNHMMQISPRDEDYQQLQQLYHHGLKSTGKK